MPTSFVALGASQISVSETLPFATVTLVRSGDLNVGPVTVDLQISSGTALPGSDYTNITIPPVVFQNGQTQAVVNIPLIADGLPEPTETFSVSIVNVSANVDLLAPRTVLVDIIDDINPVQPPVNPPLVSNYTVSLQSYISGINAPLNLDFTADGSKVYIATKDGFVYLHDAVTGARISTVLDLTAVVNNVEDRGLLDIELHPDFLTNGYFYVFYVVDPAGAAGRTGLAGADGVGNRYAHVVRYQADAATGFSTVVPGSATVIVGNAGQTIGDVAGNGAINSTDPANVGLIASDLQLTRGTGAPDTGTVRDTPAVYRGGFVQNYIKVDSSTHAGGALAFGPDGMLYISVGDGVSFNLPDPRADSVQNINSLAGKILRVDPLTGRGLTTNPFYTPGMSLDDNAAKVFQLGLRNPFSMGFDGAGRLFITSTGWFTYEQIFTGPPGANFGWPYYEGGDLGILQQSLGYNGLPTAAAFYAAVNAGTIVITPAYRAFSQDEGAPGFEVQGIVGGNVIYTGNRYPAVFQNDFFFSDFPQGEVFSIDTNDFRQIEYLLTMPQLPFLPNAFGPVHMTQGPDGYVYLVDYLGGTIHRLLISGGPNGGVTAVDDVATVAEDTVLTLAPAALLGNDTNSGGGSLTIESVTAVSGGTVALVGGQVRFTPAANFNGTAVFDYRAANGSGGDTGRVLVTVTPVEDSPIAGDDSLTAVRGRANTLTVLTNDSEPDGQALTVVSAVAASGTPVTINPDGTLTIAPPAGAAPTDTITYVIRDPGGRTDTGLVTLALVDTLPVTFATRGNAAATATPGTFTITPAAGGQIGAVVSTTRLDLSSNFTINFQMFFGAGDGGADGTAFVLQAALPMTLPGGGGSDLGYRGLPTGLAIEFDTYASDAVYGDIAADHLAFHAATTGTRLGTPVALPNIEDNAWHAVVVTWTAATQTLSVTVDGTTTATLAGVNIPATYLGGSNFAHFGFHGATGGLFNLQQVRAITASGRFEGQNAPPVAVDDTRTGSEDTVLTITAASLTANDTDADLNPLTIASVTAVTGGTVSLSGGVITFTPTANFNGPATFDYVVADGQGGTDTGRVTVTLAAVNDAPVAVDDTRTTAEDTVLTLTAASLLSNDTDVDGNPLSVTAVTAVSGGTVSLAAGVITFTPTANFNGPAAFDYTLSDGTTGTDTGRVAVTVTPVNDAPVAVDDTRGTARDTPLILTAASLVANDTDVDLNPLTITGVTAVTGGTVSLAAGVITFTPTAGFTGAAAFDYTVSDGATGTDVGRVAITVSAPVGAPPVAVDDIAATTEDTTLTLAASTLTTNDTDPDLNPLSVTAVTAVSGGTVTLAAGVITFTPTANFNGPAAFDYVVSDGQGNQDTGRVAVTVAPANDNPLAVDDTATTAEDTALTIAATSLALNDTDVDLNALTVTGVTAVSGGTVTLAGGVITFTPTANFAGPAAFDYVVADGAGGTDTGRVVVTVTAENDAPVANPDTATAVRNTAQTIAVLANDTDIDNAVLTVTSAVAASGASVTINADGTLRYLATGAVPVAATDTITYTIRDPAGLTASSTVAVTVSDVPPPPPFSFVTRGSAVATATPGTFTITPATVVQTGAVISTTRLDLGASFTMNFELFLGASDSGSDGVALVLQAALPAVLPSGGGSDLGYRGIPNGLAVEFDTFNSTAAYQDIAADHLAFHNTASGARLGGAVALPNLENNAWHAVAVSWNAGTQTLSVTVNGTTTATLAGVNIPVAHLGGSNFAHFGFHGATGGTFNLQQVRNVTVAGRFEGQGVGAPPVAVDDTAAGTEDTVLTITTATLTGNDTDADLNPLTITSVTAVTGGTVSLSGGVITFTPTANFNGAAAFDYVVSDGQGNSDVGRVAVTLAAVEDAPIAVADTATVTRGAPATIAVLTNDREVDGQALTVVSAVAASGAGVVINGDGSLRYTPPAAGSTDTITYTIRDPGGLTATSTVAVSIAAAPPPFVTRGNASATATPGTFTVTPAAAGQSGAVISTQRLDMGSNFTLNFDLFLGTSDAGADGMALVLQAALPTSIPSGAGSDLGYRGIPNGLAVEFDTFASPAAFSDITADHLAFHSTATGTRLGSAVALPNVEDGVWHAVTVTWSVATQTLTVTVDGTTTATLAGVNIPVAHLGGSTFAHFGFHGATGGGFNLQQVRNITVAGTFEGTGGGGAAPAGEPNLSEAIPGLAGYDLAATAGTEDRLFGMGALSDEFLWTGQDVGRPMPAVTPLTILPQIDSGFTGFDQVSGELSGLLDLGLGLMDPGADQWLMDALRPATGWTGAGDLGL